MKQSYRVRLESIAEQCEKLVRYAVKNGADFYAPALESDLKRVGELYKKCGGKWEALYEAAAAFEFQKLARKPKDADPEAAGFVTAQRTAVKKEIAKIREEICAMPPHAVLEGLGRAYPLLKSLQHGLLTFHRL